MKIYARNFDVKRFFGRYFKVEISITAFGDILLFMNF